MSTATRRIVGLIGYAGVGKDAICAALGWQRAAFADALKARIDPLFPTGAPESVRRPVYVAYGEAMRLLAPQYWLRQIVIPSTGDVAVCDVRYVNEAAFVDFLDGRLIRVYRPGWGPANETELQTIRTIDILMPDLPVVRNDGTIEQAADQVRHILGGAR